jgi:hypothetical protein
MVTLNQLTYDLLELIRGTIVDDEELDNRQLQYWIHNQRALWLKNEMNRFRSIDDDIVQDLGCVELEMVDAADCPAHLIGCNVLRTKKKLPDTIDLHYKSAITRVGPIDKTDRPFSFVNYQRAIFSGNSKHSKNTIYAFLLNDYMYLKIDPNNSRGKMLTHINIRGVFEDPTEAAVFCDAEGKPCYSEDSKYPVSRSIINYMKNAIVQSDLKFKVNPPGDSINDANAQVTQ